MIPDPPRYVNPDPWLTVQDAAREAKACEETILRAIRAKQLEAVRLAGGRRYRIRASAVDRWLQRFAA